LAAATTRARDALTGQFNFLNVDHACGRPIDWLATDQAQLWRYKLQYMGFLVDLAATDGGSWPAVATLIREWIQSNPFGRGRDAWHPFVVSERVVNWIIAIRLAKGAAPLDSDIATSLAIQCAFIEKNLETDVGGNHLLKNLKAVAIAGCCWSGRQADMWRTHYSGAFGRELERQLLADGAHYERSPMYHALVLQDALEVGAMLRATGETISASLSSAARAMVDYLPHVTHPDGEIALFNDSVMGDAPPPSTLHAFADRVLGAGDGTGHMTVRQAALAAHLPGPAPAATPRFVSDQPEDGGLVAIPILAGRGFALIDVGKACPDELPAHAHADLFSFEASLNGKRLIVDSGVGEYRSGRWREYYRSTRAHNSVAVDDQDQIECWGSFRVARRARVVERRAIDAPLVRGVTAAHDGYTRLADPVIARRSFVSLADRAWLVIDRLEGRGAHRWSSCLHCSPDVRIDLVGGRIAVLSQGPQMAVVAWFGAAAVDVVAGVEGPLQGWYAPEFGVHLPAPVLVLNGSGGLPAQCGYLIAPDVVPGDVALASTSNGLEIALENFRFHVQVAPESIRVTQLG
jgi:uncharacterized heparinase superfamily protein